VNIHTETTDIRDNFQSPTGGGLVGNSRVTAATLAYSQYKIIPVLGNPIPVLGKKVKRDKSVI